MIGQKWFLITLCAAALLALSWGCPATDDGMDNGNMSGGDDGGNGNDNGNGGDTTPTGLITFTLPDGHLYRIAAAEGATPEDITVALDALAPRAADTWINVSPDGQTLLVSTERFDGECAGFACLAVVAADFTNPELVRTDGIPVHPDGFGAVSSGGSVIVFPAGGGPHTRDLWIISRDDNDWSAPTVISGDSTHLFNEHPAISDDGSRVLFNCGPMPSAGPGTCVCEVNIDGTGYRMVASPDRPPAGLAAGGSAHHGDYAPDGSIVFEGEWNGERLWRVSNDSTAPIAVGEGFNNDNSPCVLPDGRVVSLWLDRPGSTGAHELKVMNGDGSDFFIPLPGTDVVDGGLGCGGGASTDGGGDDGTEDPDDGGAPVGGRFFPDGAIWYQDISNASLDAESDAVIAWLADNGGFGLGRMQIDFSIEVLEADANTPLRDFHPTEDWFDPDCDLDALPVPESGALEAEEGLECTDDGDCHLIVVDRSTHRLYEMWRANIVGDEFFGGCLAVWDMTRIYGDAGRGRNCTSADAAGFPIAPLLFTADEVAAGAIDHAIRFILPNARIRNRVYVPPATHSTGATGGPDTAPPFGARFRLRADYPLGDLPNETSRVVARALQQFGMFLADGGNVALTARSDRFSTAKWVDLMESRDLETIQITDFEMVESGERFTWTGDCVREP